MPNHCPECRSDLDEHECKPDCGTGSIRRWKEAGQHLKYEGSDEKGTHHEEPWEDNGFGD